LARWQAAGANTSGLRNVDVRIADLPGATLGEAVGHTVWLDSTAAGWGWFVDATPWDDSEYLTPGNEGEHGRMDLLTAVSHEVGHLLCHDHSDGGVMDDTLDTGVRNMPAMGKVLSEPAVVDSILALDWSGRYHRHRDDVLESLSAWIGCSNRFGLGRGKTSRR
jgi:hypothetical protein